MYINCCKVKNERERVCGVYNYYILLCESDAIFKGFNLKKGFFVLVLGEKVKEKE